MTATLYAHHPSPMGSLLLVGERAPDGGTVLTGCYFPGHRRGPAVDPAWDEDPAAFAAIGAALDAAAGRRRAPARPADPASRSAPARRSSGASGRSCGPSRAGRP